jgi:predicted DNA-binding protein (MmcQ/YjbR family)
VSESDAIARIRDICLALPEVAEKPFGGHTAPAFRVRDKLFATTSEDGSFLTFKGGPGVLEALVAAEPERFFVPAYVGSKGWVGARLDAGHDWDELAELIQDSYRMIAPRGLAAQVPAGPGPGPGRGPEGSSAIRP